MKRFLCRVLIPTLLFAALFSVSVFANESESLWEFADGDTLLENIPDSVDRSTLSSLSEDVTQPNFYSRIFSLFIEAFLPGLQDGLDFFVRILALLLFSALYKSIKDSFGAKGLGGAFDFLFFLSLALICFASLEDSLTLSLSALSAIKDFFFASLPVTTVLLSLSGSSGTGALMASNLSFFLGASTAFVQRALTPLLRALFAFSMIDGCLDSGLSSLLAYIKKTVKTLLILSFTLVAATLSLQNALGTAADSLTMRSARFAAGTFIPVVGSLVGESSRTLSAAFSLVKAKCGVICILVLAYVLLRPILALALQKFFLSLAAAFGEILGENRFSKAISSLHSLVDLLMALVIAEGVYLIFYMALFLSNKGSY